MNTVHTPTEEQQEIIDLAISSGDNILVSASAGAAKTTSLYMIAEALAPKNMLCLAFNKRIAVEMDSHFPPNCTAMTLNSLGHRTWINSTGKRSKINSKKGYEIMKEEIEKYDGRDLDELYKRMGELMRIVAFGKACGYIPTGTYDSIAKRLMDDEAFFSHIEQKLNELETKLVRDCTLVSLKQSFEGTLDFDDQILMPTIFQGAFSRYPLILVDEAQDLSALNHAMLRKLCKASRLIAVGDRCQAIYGFRGAHADSMNELQQAFSMTEKTLSISFRCSKSITRAAQWRAPNMRWPNWAKEGSVTSLTSWTAQNLPNNTAVLCRNNAPLFALAIKLLKNGRHAELASGDVAKMIMNIMRKFGSSNLPQIQVFDAIERWTEDQRSKNKKRAWGSIEDRASCMSIFAGEGKDLGDALAYGQHLIQLTSPIKLMTGHKAKGLEFDHVFFLDADLCSKDQQDPNVRYVIITRARETLTYVRLEDFIDNS